MKLVKSFSTVLLLVGLVPGGVWAQDKEEVACNPTVAAEVKLQKVTDEDGKVDLVAEVKRQGTAVKGVQVDFSTPRLFGVLSLGVAETDENGQAKLRFPEDLPGDATTGVLQITAKVVKSPTYFGETKAAIEGGAKLQVVEDPFPRAIWSPKTDWYLLLTIPTLIACVWSVYIFAFGQLRRISKLR